MKETLELFKKRTGYVANLDSPTTFNEKVQWRKFYQHWGVFPIMVDKLASRDLARSRCKDVDFTEVYWQGRSPNMVVFRVPCVVKPNAMSGYNCFVVEKPTYEMRKAVVRKLTSAMSRVYGSNKGEWAYSQVTPMVFCEEYLAEFLDVKFFVFHGEVKVVNLMGYGKGHTITNCSYFTPEGVWRDVKNVPYPVAVKEMPIPGGVLAKGKRLAEELSGDCDFVRVDLYYIKDGDRWVFGEYTLYPTSGMARFEPRSFDEELGSYWRLP